MAKNRYINTSFWRDGYICNLDPSEKLVFLYFITKNLNDNNLPLCSFFKIIECAMYIDNNYFKKIVALYIKLINEFSNNKSNEENKNAMVQTRH